MRLPSGDQLGECSQPTKFVRGRSDICAVSTPLPLSSMNPRPQTAASSAATVTNATAIARRHRGRGGRPVEGAVSMPSVGSPSAAPKCLAEANRSAGTVASARGWLDQLSSHDRLRRGSGEWRVSGQHLVRDAAEGVDVAPDVRAGLARRLLGAHVKRRAQAQAGLRQSLTACLAQRGRDAEVRDGCVPTGNQDVRGLDVPVDDAGVMSRPEAIGDFARDLDRVAYR
jgi:hypothetical protein